MLVKVLFSLDFLLTRFFLNFILLFGILCRLLPVRITCRTGQAHFGVEHRRLDALGLIKCPLISRFDLFHHCFVGVTTRKQSGNRRQHRQNGCAQRHPRDPFLAALFCMMMNLFVQMFERDLGFLHQLSLKSRAVRSRLNRQAATATLNCGQWKRPRRENSIAKFAAGRSCRKTAPSARTCGLRSPNSSNHSDRTGIRSSSFVSATSARFAEITLNTRSSVKSASSRRSITKSSKVCEDRKSTRLNSSH